MGISLFYLSAYKDIRGCNTFYEKGRCDSCSDYEFEAFKPIWNKIRSGNFPGSQMKLKRRILDKEYSMYPIVFIDSHYWCPDEVEKGHGHTSIFIVQAQNQNVANCKSYENRFIDRELGVIILDKTTIHGKGVEPDYKNWFYERDTREDLPTDILSEEFSEKGPGIFLIIKKYAVEETEIDVYTEIPYIRRAGHLRGEHIANLVAKNTIGDESLVGCLLIQWQDSWNFVVYDNYGQKMYRVSNPDAEAFLERNNIF